MKIVDKYLLREYLIPVTYCLSAFCMIQIIYDLFANFPKFLDAETPFRLVARYYCFVLIPTLEYLIPASLLLATLYTLWRFTKHNELTAMRASGISFFRIMMPFLAVGIAFSIAATVLKETIAPKAAIWSEEFSKNGFVELKNKTFFNHAYFNPVSRRQWNIDQFDIKNPQHLTGVSLSQEREDRSRISELNADSAQWLDGEWWFFNGNVNEYNTQGAITNNVILAKAGTEIRGITESPLDFKDELYSGDKTWELFFTSRGMINYLKAHPKMSKAASAKKRYYLHKRLAMPWACLVVALFGIPAGAKSGRQSALTGIFIAIAFFFAFYALMNIGAFLAIRRWIDPWIGAWLSNIVFCITGFTMLFKIR